MTTNIVSSKTYSFRYSFAVDGGAISTIQAPFTLPANCIVTNVTLNVIAAVVSAANGASVEIGTGAGANSANWFTAIVEASLGTGVILTEEPAVAAIIAAGGEKPSITILGEALTGGIFDVTIEYIER
jgi:hypothetical protein